MLALEAEEHLASLLGPELTYAADSDNISISKFKI
jgi:hypothetical protein